MVTCANSDSAVATTVTVEFPFATSILEPGGFALTPLIVKIDRAAFVEGSEVTSGERVDVSANPLFTVLMVTYVAVPVGTLLTVVNPFESMVAIPPG